MRIGVVLPTRGLLLDGREPDARRLIALARRAEDAGIDSVWVGDSLTAKPRLEPLSVLAAVAASTEHVGLGTAVLLGALRQPVLLAQAAATVDLISGGRLTLGLGVGGAFTPEQQREWSAAGVEMSQRAARLAEVVAVIQKLWLGAPIQHDGTHFQLHDVGIGFKPARRPRIRTILACHSGENRGAQYRRAARLADGMISITDTAAEFAAVREAVLSEVQARGRPRANFDATFYMTVHLDDDSEAAWQEGDRWVRLYYGLNFWQERWGPYGPAAAVLERAQSYVEAGADEIVFRFAAFDQETQLERFIEEVLPSLRAKAAGAVMR